MATTTATRAQDLLSSEFLTQLERLALLSRRAFRGRTRGERKSPHKGMSVEFADYRPYGAGDDLRYVDWNIYGRLDRLYLKLFVDEEDLYLHLLLDGSGSMRFGEPSKLRYAARLAAALGFVGLASLERVGGPWCANGWRKAGARRAGAGTFSLCSSSRRGSAQMARPRSTTDWLPTRSARGRRGWPCSSPIC